MEELKRDPSLLAEAHRRFPKGSRFVQYDHSSPVTSDGLFKWWEDEEGLYIATDDEDETFIWSSNGEFLGDDGWVLNFDDYIGDVPNECLAKVSMMKALQESSDVDDNVDPPNAALTDAVDEYKKGFKKDSGKSMLSLVFRQFPLAMNALCDRAMFGHRKYIEHDADFMNWRRIDDPIQRYTDSALRHFSSYISGEVIDEESGQPHIMACLWCMAAITQLEEEIRIHGKIQ